jgi:predicted Fe-Mo cluster-binding NifX family protein
MLLLIPIDGENIQSAELCELKDMKKFALLTHEDGQVKEVEYHDTLEEIEGWIDIVIVTNEKENVWPFMERQIGVLIARYQRSIDDVLEAFLFKELHQMNF